MIPNGNSNFCQLAEVRIIYRPPPIFNYNPQIIYGGLSLVSFPAILESLFGFLETLSSLFWQYNMGPGLAKKYSHNLEMLFTYKAQSKDIF